jgi:hypothetical protein
MYLSNKSPRELVGLFLLEPSTFDGANDSVLSGVAASEYFRYLRAMIQLHAQGRAIDILNMDDQLHKNGSFLAGDISALSESIDHGTRSLDENDVFGSTGKALGERISVRR